MSYNSMAPSSRLDLSSALLCPPQMLIHTCFRLPHINLYAFIKTGIHIVFIFACKSIHIMFMDIPGTNVPHENFIRFLSLTINNLKHTHVYEAIPPHILLLHKSTWEGRNVKTSSEFIDNRPIDRTRRRLVLKESDQEERERQRT